MEDAKNTNRCFGYAAAYGVPMTMIDRHTCWHQYFATGARPYGQEISA